jgi:hypothetical protein
MNFDSSRTCSSLDSRWTFDSFTSSRKCPNCSTTPPKSCAVVPCTLSSTDKTRCNCASVISIVSQLERRSERPQMTHTSLSFASFHPSNSDSQRSSDDTLLSDHKQKWRLHLAAKLCHTHFEHKQLEHIEHSAAKCQSGRNPEHFLFDRKQFTDRRTVGTEHHLYQLRHQVRIRIKVKVECTFVCQMAILHSPSFSAEQFESN